MLPSYKRVDTCAAEFEAETPYMYSSYDGASEAAPSSSKKVLILGGGPNRIGQGIEFDYCCCHASFSLRSVSCPARPSASDTLYLFEKQHFEVHNVLHYKKKQTQMGRYAGCQV